MRLNKWFAQFAEAVSRAARHALAFIACCAVVLIWAASSAAFWFSDAWQLVINTSTTTITFLMVFLIQNTQERDEAATHAKLDELIRYETAPHSRLTHHAASIWF
jgi:low affinity Fe/Cu permease